MITRAGPPWDLQFVPYHVGRATISHSLLNKLLRGLSLRSNQVLIFFLSSLVSPLFSLFSVLQANFQRRTLATSTFIDLIGSNISCKSGHNLHTICSWDLILCTSPRRSYKGKHVTHLKASDHFESGWIFNQYSGKFWLYRIIEHDCCNNCSSSKEENLIAHTLHLVVSFNCFEVFRCWWVMETFTTYL